jgi:hypothetical protein
MKAFTKVAVLDNAAEAGALEAALQAEGIPFALHSYYDSAYDGMFQTQMGWGHVSAPEDRVEEVAAILRGLRDEAGEPPDEKA